MDFRGRPEEQSSTVGAGGIRTRYQADGYDGIRNEWTTVTDSSQFEWYRDNNLITKFITVSNTLQGVFEAFFCVKLVFRTGVSRFP